MKRSRSVKCLIFSLTGWLLPLLALAQSEGVHIVSAPNDTLFSAGKNGFKFALGLQTPAPAFQILSAGSVNSLFTVAGNGNVGLGLAEPVARLDVADGAAWFRGQDTFVRAEIGAYAADGQPTAQAGYLALYNPNGYLNVASGWSTLDPMQGMLSVYGANGYGKAYLFSATDSVGTLELLGQNQADNVLLSHTYGYPNNGWIGVQGADGFGYDGVRMFVSAENAGQIHAFGANGNFNAYVGNLPGYPNNGYISVMDSDGYDQAGLYVDSAGRGILFGQFGVAQIATPERADAMWYAGLSGPQAMIYICGTQALIQGRATIRLPADFAAAVQTNGMVVQLTPLSADSKGLAVIKKSPAEITVQELANGAGNYSFDWEVKCLRLDAPAFETLRESGPRVRVTSAPAARYGKH